MPRRWASSNLGLMETVVCAFPPEAGIQPAKARDNGLRPCRSARSRGMTGSMGGSSPRRIMEPGSGLGCGAGACELAAGYAEGRICARNIGARTCALYVFGCCPPGVQTAEGALTARVRRAFGSASMRCAGCGHRPRLIPASLCSRQAEAGGARWVRLNPVIRCCHAAPWTARGTGGAHRPRSFVEDSSR